MSIRLKRSDIITYLFDRIEVIYSYVLIVRAGGLLCMQLLTRVMRDL